MDEMLRNKALIEQILARANSISQTMSSVDRRLTVLNERMDQQQQPKEADLPPLQLMDLHESVLSQVVAQLGDAAAVCALSRACKGMRDLAAEYDWQALCRAHWGITQSDSARVRRMDADLIQGYSKIDKATDSSVVWEQRKRGNPWRNIYRDRTFGWKIVIKMLQWLRMHCHPPNVAGVSHRFQLYLALSYMDMCTCTTEEEARREEILKLDGVASLIGLLGNSHPIFRAQAAAVLANIMFERPEVQDQVLVATFQGKKLSDRLETEPTSQTQQMSRALVNMWVQHPVPQVVLFNNEAEIALPDLRSGLWQLQEYSLRGDTFEKIDVVLSFSRDGSLCGGGSEIFGDEPEDFIVEGSIGSDHKWEFSKIFSNQHRVVYKGYSDLHGAYGVYYPVRRWDSSFGSMASPKVFRLFRDKESELFMTEPCGDGIYTKSQNADTVDEVIKLVQEMWSGRVGPIANAAASSWPMSIREAAAAAAVASDEADENLESSDEESCNVMRTSTIPGLVDTHADDADGSPENNPTKDSEHTGTLLIAPDSPAASEATTADYNNSPASCGLAVADSEAFYTISASEESDDRQFPLCIKGAESSLLLRMPAATTELDGKESAITADTNNIKHIKEGQQQQLASSPTPSWMDDVMEDLLRSVTDISV